MASTPSPRWSALPGGFGTLLRTARTEAGLSRPRLAAALHVSVGQLRDVENDRRPPSAEVAERLRDVLALDSWRSALLMSVAVDTGQLRTRRGVRHINRRGAPLPPEVGERIAAERAAGRSWRGIAAALNEDRVPGVEGGRWWASSVSRAAAQLPLSVPPPTLMRQDQRKGRDAQR